MVETAGDYGFIRPDQAEGYGEESSASTRICKLIEFYAGRVMKTHKV